MTVKFTEIIAIADKPNGNGHIYPKAELERAMEEYMTKTHRYGHIGNIPSTQVDLDRISHKLDSYKWEGDELKGTITTLNTESGEYLEMLLTDELKLTLGISCTAKVGDDVINDMKITSIDVIRKKETNR